METMAPGQLARLSAHLVVLLSDPDGDAHVCEVGSARVYRVPSTWITREATLTCGNLTPREVEVLRAAAEGRSNKEIATMTHGSSQTVKNHLTSIYKKLKVAGRVGAVRWLMDQSPE